MNMEEFLPNDLDVQKAVVESLAADKAEQGEKLNSLIEENANLKSQISNQQSEISNQQAEISNRQAEISDLKSEISDLKGQIAEMKKALENVGDVLAKNAEGEVSSKVTLLERNPEIDDRFPGETRDHVLEVLREARETAEKDGRLRRAQVLESVLVANEPAGELAKKRTELEKIFAENANIVNGPVIEELTKRGIAHKKGEEYLLPGEILKRVY